jgi:uncharacterized protein (DUF1697 family)
MKCHVALFRGVNVGRAKRIAMADLRKMLAGLGYMNARTLLNSGNAVFDAPSGSPEVHAQKIRAALAKELEVDAQVVVKTATEFASVVAENPMLQGDKDPSRFLVVFTQQSSTLAALVPLSKATWFPEALAVGRNAAYMWCPRGIIESKVAQAVNRALGENATARNWSTVLKLSVLFKENGA